MIKLQNILLFYHSVISPIAVKLFSPPFISHCSMQNISFSNSSVHASSLHPLLAYHHLCYVDVYCVFFFFYFCYMLLFVNEMLLLNPIAVHSYCPISISNYGVNQIFHERWLSTYSGCIKHDT